MKLWRQESPFGEVTVVVSDAGVREISLPGDDQPDGEPGAPDRRSRANSTTGSRASGTRSTSSSTSRASRASGALALETLAREVGWGETVTYGELADLAGRPRAARAAGSAMRDNPLPFVIPCHRVVAAGGRIGGYGGGRNAVDLKRKLLAREGVTDLR